MKNTSLSHKRLLDYALTTAVTMYYKMSGCLGSFDTTVLVSDVMRDSSAVVVMYVGDFTERMLVDYTVRLIATAPVRDAAMELREEIGGYGMSHDPETGAYREREDSALFERLRDAERLFLIAARRELGIYQEGDLEAYRGIPIA